MGTPGHTHAFTAVDERSIAAAKRDDCFAWLDLVEPEPSEVRELGRQLGWHPLLVEDAISLGQRPKVESYDGDGLAFVIAYGATPPSGEVPAGLVEVALVISGGYIVSIRQREVALLDELRLRIDEVHDTGWAEASVVYRIVDRLVDSTLVASEHVSARLEELEVLIETNPTNDLLPQLRQLRRKVATYQSVFSAQRTSLADLPGALAALDELDDAEDVHFRDVSDHAWRVSNELQLAQELVNGSFESYFAALASHQGKVSQRLTVVATIFLPLTFVTGFFGQNFGWMVDHVASEQDFLWFGVGGSVLSVLVLTMVIAKLRWWS
ncbi:MAG: magnesium and cobalt transport protein CorA [Thermoleophilia bacterium]|nr:magnesium and cobalt transport protein CorA [Thermoleophilia bacterium]